MRLRILSIFAMSIALIAGELQAQVVFDNTGIAGDANVNFGGGAGFPNSRAVLGETFDTLVPTNPGDTFLVDTVNLNMILFASDNTAFNGVEVEVSFFTDVTDTAFGTPIPTLLGSETFALGDLTGDVTDNTTFLQAFEFTDAIDIGDGQDIGISFGFSDIDDAQIGNISGTYRNRAGSDNTPSVGTTTDINFRDANNDGVLDGNSVANGGDGAFRFGTGAGLRFSVEASTVAVPEPASTLVLGLLGMGLITRRRR